MRGMLEHKRMLVNLFRTISKCFHLCRTKKLSEAQVVAKQEINKMRNAREEELQREMQKVSLVQFEWIVSLASFPVFRKRLSVKSCQSKMPWSSVTSR